MNLALASLSFAGDLRQRQGNRILEVAVPAGVATSPRAWCGPNLYIAILNLMPAILLDGGRIAQALFSRTTDIPPPRGAPSPSARRSHCLVFADLFSDSW